MEVFESTRWSLPALNGNALPAIHVLKQHRE
jgi:hypothetical protein